MRRIVLIQPKRDGRVFGKSPGSPYTLMRLASLVPDEIPVEIWDENVRDLALDTLREAGIPASKTQIFGHGGQRFLEIERFDRIGNLGRRALFSLAALDAEFVGAGAGGWPLIARHLVIAGQIRPEAAHGANLLWAFGTLIGNSDMHSGNLSFVAERGRPYNIAPAYDMTPMALASRTGGGICQ